ncbi:bifunctional 2-polyprenyl-6-hydroxyphenol methylase/3-demethylubiquinol 3-O-methyltransferase UbiG [Arthrobacter sp. N199823]|uniref:class I SAM-dependent methyltransferase n=1 Tax=Arthrobacter sp. N199823 TaxID=2058895 RepID=UPI0021570835|nr:class I SAM-dependent methyltransferase [Arthrobacter sp. N199823]
MTNLFDENFWDERYSGSTTVWSGQANPQLLAEMSDPDVAASSGLTSSGPASGQTTAPTAGLTPGLDNELGNEPRNEQRNDQSGATTDSRVARSALDVGCGEGADAVWLARHGWDVTAVDISRVALKRAAGHASELELAGSIRWEHHNLLTWRPPAFSFDLVSAQFMHLPKVDREPLYSRLAAAVAPGGTLLIVGHSASDIQAGARRPAVPDLYFTAAEIADSLDSKLWQVLVAEPRPRMAKSPEGKPITIHDEVLRATRLA